MSGAGALIISVSAFLPVTGEDGPMSLTTLGVWVVGSKGALLAPLLLVVGWVFLLSFYPSKRPSAQRGQVLAFGVELTVFFLSMTIASFTEFWGGFGIGVPLALVGAGLVVVGAVRPRRESKPA
jgi:cytochrome c biogenesis factor